MSLVRAWVIITVLVVGVRSAAATCLEPFPVLSPFSGAVLPKKSSVYLFLPQHQWGFDHTGRSPKSLLKVVGARFTTHVVATTPIYRVVRIDLEATASTVEVTWPADSGGTGSTYSIGDPPANAATITSVVHHYFRWAASRDNAINVRITSTAVVYRAEWSDGTSTLIPPFTSSQRETARHHVLEIGHVGCLGHIVDPVGLATPRELRLIAVFSDGTEQTIGRGMVQLDADGTTPIVPKIMMFKPTPPGRLL